MYRREASYCGKLLWMPGKCLLHWCNKLLHQAAHQVYCSHSKTSGSKAITKTSAISLKTQESHIIKYSIQKS